MAIIYGRRELITDYPAYQVLKEMCRHTEEQRIQDLANFHHSKPKG